MHGVKKIILQNKMCYSFQVLVGTFKQLLDPSARADRRAQINLSNTKRQPTHHRSLRNITHGLIMLYGRVVLRMLLFILLGLWW